MARSSVIPEGSFDEILDWLNPDRELAAGIYVELRASLTKIFTWNRCPDPESLTDETIDRVAKQVHQRRETFDGDPKLFFYGVARNLVKESQRKSKLSVSLDGIDLPMNPSNEVEEETAEMREECLHSCLHELSSEKRELILAYYAKEKQAKIDHRTEIARQLKIPIETLRVQAYRIRGVLEDCIEHCLERHGLGNETN